MLSKSLNLRRRFVYFRAVENSAPGQYLLRLSYTSYISNCKELLGLTSATLTLLALNELVERNLATRNMLEVHT